MTKPFFEATFTNLDLSEFNSDATNSTTSKNSPSAGITTTNAGETFASASQQLLQTKQKESIQKQYDLEQEEYIQTKAKQRLEEQLQKISKNDDNDDDINRNASKLLETNSRGCTNGSKMMYNALLSMHDNDANGKQLEKRGNNNSVLLGKRKDQNNRRVGRGSNTLKNNMKTGMIKKRRSNKHSYKKR